MLFFSGTRVIAGVDAKKLQEHNILSSEQFDIVVFNFPHVGGKMRIEKNRDLLKNFFISVRSILKKDDGKVFVSLCDGQGGTPADKSKRQWNDSWQVTEMAAHGDFLLVAIETFDSNLFETYTVTGYRSLEKQFNTEGSLTHIFKLADKPCQSNIAPKHKINLQQCYCKSITYQKMLTETDNNDYNSQIKGDLSMYPNTYNFDITLSINPEFSVAKLYETLYNYAGVIIHNVEFLYSYKFSDLRETNTFRITYNTSRFAVHRKLIVDLHQNVISDVIEKALNVTVSR